MTTDIRFRNSEEAWRSFKPSLVDWIERKGARDVAELGAGANPTLDTDYTERQGISYSCLDISEDELAKAPPTYRKIAIDIGSNKCELRNEFDLVFSKMLAEHVQGAEAMHRNVFSMLRPGGYAFHFFPTLYAPPYVVNLLLPSQLAHWLVAILQPSRALKGHRGKFPAYYTWCRGPTRSQISRFERLGYEVVQYHGFFGHEGYYKQLPLVMRLHRRVASWLIAHPIPHLTSFSQIVLRKPG